MKKILLAGIFLFPSISMAATKTPILKICSNNSTGALTAKARCKFGETQLTRDLLTGAQGPAGNNGANGVNGANGANGTFDPAKCVKRESSAAGTGVVTVSAACLVSEIAIATGCASTSNASIVHFSELNNGSNAEYPDLYGTYTCSIEDFNGASHTATAQLMCCRP